MFVHFIFIFFFKQKTAYELRISDWTSDVCSSDLVADCHDGLFCLRFAADLLAGDVDHAWSEQSPARYLGPRLWFPENASRAVRHAGWPRSTVRYQRRGSRRDRAGQSARSGGAARLRRRLSRLPGPAALAREHDSGCAETFTPQDLARGRVPVDRKSTRLNSSH